MKKNSKLHELLLLAASALASTATLLAGCSSDDDAADSAGASGNTEAGATPPPEGSLDIVLNEFSATGSSEWIEIANKGKSAFDLGGYGIADSEKGTTTPKVADAMRFPAGTTIAAGGRIVILTSKDDQAPGPYTKDACLANGPDSCFYATFGVSATSGESVHLLGKDDAVITSTAYPRNLGVDGTANQTACRIPDLTGDFVTCTATPGSANAAVTP